MVALAAVASLAFGCTSNEGDGAAPDAERAAAERGTGGHLGRYFPERLASFQTSGATRTGVARIGERTLVSGERSYEHEGREAVLRIIDVREEPELRATFGLTRELRIEDLDELARPLTLAHEPAIVQWSRATGESEAQVLVGERYLVSVKVWPADRPDEATTLLSNELLGELARLR